VITAAEWAAIVRGGDHRRERAVDFWDFFFLCLIYVPLMLVWAFAVLDVFRRDDLGGVGKAAWLACVVLVPFFGTLVYLIARPAGATLQERAALDDASRQFVARHTPDNRAEQLRVLADLHDRGKLTDEEFAAEKARMGRERVRAGV
jgi:hypothetical protein